VVNDILPEYPWTHWQSLTEVRRSSPFVTLWSWHVAQTLELASVVVVPFHVFTGHASHVPSFCVDPMTPLVALAEEKISPIGQNRPVDMSSHATYPVLVLY
jgi:hypothetical protein